MKTKIVLGVALLAASVISQQSEIAKWDPAMAASKAVVDTNGVKWVDGRYLPIEGRWELGNTDDNYYARLPNTLTQAVNGGVRGMRTHTSGMQFRFKTDSHFLILRIKNGGGSMNHMTAVGTSGWDVYRLDERTRMARFVASSHGEQRDQAKPGFRVKRIGWERNAACIVNLPLYSGVEAFEIGIAKESKIEALSPRRSGILKPVVFYGTSITHGGCCTRPGLGFVNIVGRDLDVPVFGLGFSGSGVMEYELSDVISRIDASCYVLDCLWNMSSAKDGGGRPGRNVETNYEPFIRNLRAKRPDVPIIMAEQCDVFMRGPNNKDKYMKALYEKLVAEGWTNLFYLSKDKMYTGDVDGTVDGCHPNDLGMRSMANAFGAAVKTALNLK